MPIIRPPSVASMCAALIVLAAAEQASAQQQYPAQPITIVVAAAAGGFADGVARTIGDKLRERFDQSVVIENKGGAGGNLGARQVAQSKPDGYTLLVSTTAMAINSSLYTNLGYSPQDIRAVAVVGSAPEAIVVHPSSSVRTLSELVAAGKTKSIEFGTAGVGTGSHIAAEYLFRILAKVQTVHVPFPGGAPAITAVLGNHITAIAATVSPLITHINSGALRGLGIASEKRLAVVPDVPTYAESGFPNFFAASWVGFFAPARTDEATLRKLNTAINESLDDPGVQERLKKFGLDPMRGDLGRTTGFFAGEVEHWGRMVNALSLSIN